MITQERLKEVFNYCPDTGIFTRLTSKNSRAKAGDISGTKTPDGYLVIRIDYKLFQAHRLAWLYVNGCTPPEDIDHINGFRDDNRIKNLRCVSRAENLRNQKTRKGNTSGVMGVYWNKKRKVWSAQISIEGKNTYIGSYPYKFNAICARKSEENNLGYHENHGRVRA